MKKAKATCRRINKQGFGNIQQQASEALSALKDIQLQLLSDPSDSLFCMEFVARRKWQFFEATQEIFFNRKSRIRWLDCGDTNSKFFYKAVVAHKVRNAISYLLNAGGLRVFNQTQIKDMVVAYFQNLLGSEDVTLLGISVEELRSLIPYRCPQNIAEKLTSLPSDEEVKSTLFAMPKNKAPGPDGYSAEFFWEAWEIIGKDLIDAVKEFFVAGHMLRQFNTTAISLIPKIVGADQLHLFRPISLCSTVYKVMARLLKKKLKLCVAEIV